MLHLFNFADNLKIVKDIVDISTQIIKIYRERKKEDTSNKKYEDYIDRAWKDLDAGKLHSFQIGNVRVEAKKEEK